MSRRMGLLVALVISIGVFLADQGLKRVVEGSMRLEESIPVIPGVFHLTYIRNEGGAFGILAGQGIILLAGSAVAVAAVLWILLSSPPSKLLILSCGLVLGGAAGNLLDRLTTGAVTDYLDVRVWPIFNAADVAITLGVGLLLLTALLPEKAKSSRDTSPDSGN